MRFERLGSFSKKAIVPRNAKINSIQKKDKEGLSKVGYFLCFPLKI